MQKTPHEKFIAKAHCIPYPKTRDKCELQAALLSRLWKRKIDARGNVIVMNRLVKYDVVIFKDKYPVVALWIKKPIKPNIDINAFNIQVHTINSGNDVRKFLNWYKD